MKKIGVFILIGFLCVGSILSGVYCGIKWYKDAHSKSHVIGALEVNNNTTQDNFSYSNAENPIVFYHDDYNSTGLYYFTAELDAVPSFDGDKKQYEILLNDYLILEPTILFRMVSFRVYINFKDVDSSLLCETYFDVSIKFLSDKTDFRIEMYGEENSQYVARYIESNGFELFINEIKENV